MTPRGKLIGGLFALAAIAAALSSAMTAWMVSKNRGTGPQDFHAWIHAEMSVTEDQARLLEPIELRYEENKRHLTELIRLANHDLALAIAEDRSNSPRVQAAVRKIHDAMGQLQQATLEHIFEMKALLRPDQYDRLITLTQEALDSQSRAK